MIKSTSKKYLLFLFINLCFTSIYAVEFGMASMFSDNFHNKKTASGELYDVNKMTASHKSLPFGSKIKITRLDNNQSVIARVNDRGPYTKGRIVELSRKAAREIGLNDGEVKVKVELISTSDDEAKPKPAPIIKDEEPEPKKIIAKGDVKKKKIDAPKEIKNLPKPAEIAETPKTVPVKPTKSTSEGKLRSGELMKIQVAKPDREGFGLQVATLSSYEAAISKIDDLEGDFYKNVLIFTDKNGEKPAYKIILGPFPDVTTAETYKKAAKKKKMDGFIINLRTMERPN
jgi:rare lipoprotein A